MSRAGHPFPAWDPVGNEEGVCNGGQHGDGELIASTDRRARLRGPAPVQSNMVAEEVDSTPAVLALGRRPAWRCRWPEQVRAIPSGARSPEYAVEVLMGRGLTAELNDLGGSRSSRASEGPVWAAPAGPRRQGSREANSCR